MGTCALSGKCLLTGLFVFAVCWITIEAKVNYLVLCTEDTMNVEVERTDDVQDIYLEQLEHYPDPACHPAKEGNKAVFRLSLRDIQQCGVTRVANQITGRLVYYHRVVVKSIKKKPAKQVITVKCIMEPHRLNKRNVLPAGFQEPEFLEITTNLTEKAPEPMLGVGVRQGGQLVTGELNVNPGTPLQMEIFLDKGSAPIYGLLVSYMQVTDTKAQEETIIFNGCSVDPYLFENFNTVDGDFLSAKFRAFKFPESTYVQFTGTVNVCLDKCRGVDCSNGQTGFGRRKRAVSAIPADPNKVFEVTMTTFIKVDYKEDKMLEKGKVDALPPKPKNGTDVAAGDINNHVYDKQHNQNLKLETEEIREELEYTVIDQSNSAACFHPLVLTTVMTLLTLAIHF